MFKVEPWNNVRWKIGEMYHSLDKCLFFLAIKVMETIWLDLIHRQIILDERNLACPCGTWEIILLFCCCLHIHKMGHIMYLYIKNMLQNLIHGNCLLPWSKRQHRDCTTYFSKGKKCKFNTFILSPYCKYPGLACSIPP